MATNDAIFSAQTQTTVITGTTTRASGAFSTAAECTNPISNNLRPMAKATLSCSFSTAPTANMLVNLYRRGLAIDGTNDAETPSSAYPNEWVGAFPINAVTTQQYAEVMILLIEGDQEFYIENDTDQTMDADYIVTVKPLTYVPSA